LKWLSILIVIYIIYIYENDVNNLIYILLNNTNLLISTDKRKKGPKTPIAPDLSDFQK
jgi:hypothetical protein